MTTLAVALAGALGAACRFVVDFLVTSLWGRVLPAGTLVVNTAGSAAAGMAAAWATTGLDGTVRLVVATGFLGAFTTFSTFAVETMRLAEAGTVRVAAVNVALGVGASVAAAAVGYWAVMAL